VIRAVVLGLMAIASAVVRARGSSLDEAARQLDVDRTAMSATPATVSVEDVRVTGGPFVVPADGDDDAASSESVVVPDSPGDWAAACQLKTGSALMFDRGSLRELGPVMLVRWAAPTDPRTEGRVYTAVVDCREKTIEAAWPGKRSDTRAGTCGRRLVDAVCEQAKQREHAPRVTPSRSDGRRERATTRKLDP
jgi:hypothetical protein